jgi:glycosyltransferase involved in cell wall biosynthesis
MEDYINIMKIALVTKNFYPVMGGVETYVHEIARRLAKKHDVHVFCASKKRKDEIIDNIKVHRIPIQLDLSYYLFFFPLVSELKKYDFDVIHFQGHGIPPFDRAVMYEKSKKTPLVCTPHALVIAPRKRPMWQNIVRNIYDMTWGSWMYSMYDKVIQVNPYQKEWLVKHGVKRENIVFVPEGVNKEDFKKVNVKGFKRKYCLKNSLLFVGRVHENKGVQHLIKVFSKLEKEFKDYKLVIFGGDWKGHKKKFKSMVKELKIQDRVVFVKDLSNKEKLRAYASANIFVLPSYIEAFGIVIVEAMAQGLPIVTTKTQGAKFLVNKDNGALVDIGNENQLYSSLKRLMSNKALQRKISIANRSKAKKFLWDRTAEETLKVYKSINVS